MRPKVTIDRARWRSGHNGDDLVGKGLTGLLNIQGYMCCLGFYCLQLGGLDTSDILGIPAPGGLKIDVQGLTECPRGSRRKETKFTNKAVGLNDNLKLTRTQRESKLTELFDAEGIDLVFEGKYE